MLGLAEYIAAKNDLFRLARKIEATLKDLITPDTDKNEAVATGLKLAREYRQGQRTIFATAMQQTVHNALLHYEKKLDIHIEDESISDKILEAQWEEKYYGSTLSHRLKYNDTLLAARVTRSAEIDPIHVTDVWTNSVPFGAHWVQDRTLLLGTLVKIEQDVAREYGARTEHKLMRWTLSHRHSKEDVCDHLASYVDRDVARYLKEHNLHISPRGLYFVDHLPVPPHPNCQCEYGVLKGKNVIGPGRVERALERVKGLLRRVFK